MKKITALLLTAAIVFCLVSCNTTKQIEKQKAAEYACANEAYSKITASGDLCVDIMDSVYDAWFFAIYNSDDYSGRYSTIDAFATKTGTTYAEVVSGFKALGYDEDDYYLLSDFSYAVHIIIATLNEKGIYEQAENHLLEAKTNLKQVTSEYSDYTGYPTLKLYYSEVSSYLEFAKSPSGSFSQLKTTIDNYETNIRTYKNDLSFIFD